MTKIYFWRDIYGDQVIFARYADKIEALFSGVHLGLSPEKLKIACDPPIFSIRLNDKDRLLFTTYQNDLFLLDVVLNHDYAKSRFFRNPQRVFASISKLLDTEIKFNFDESDFTPLEAAFHFSLSSSRPSYQPLDFYQDHFIQLSREQEKMFQVPLPGIVMGPAGSGKTSSAFSLLANYILTHQAKLTQPILYLTQSRILAQDMAQNWRKLYGEAHHDQVKFLTYDELYGFDSDQYDVFLVWYAERRGLVAASRFEIEPKLLWKEFRIRAGCEASTDYLGLGLRQSLIADLEQRRQVDVLFHHFKLHLAQLGLKSPVFDEVSEVLPFSFAIVDESQDLSIQQLKSLYYGLSGQLLYLLGSHQILYDGKSKLLGLKNFLFHQGHRVEVHCLNRSYRNTQGVINVANALIEQKLKITGGLSDKLEEIELEIADELKGRGEAYWLSEKMAASFPFEFDADLALITSESLLTEAKTKFATPLIYSPKTVKGLEFHTVILWNLFTGAEAEEITRKLTSTPSRAVAKGRAKSGNGDDQHLVFFNELITAATRAKQRLIIIQNIEHTNRALCLPIQARMSLTPSASTDCVLPVSLDWSQRFQECLGHGLLEQAEAIFIEKMGGDQAEFLLYLQQVSDDQAKPRPVHPALALLKEVLAYDKAKPNLNQRLRLSNLQKELYCIRKDELKSSLLYYLQQEDETLALLYALFNRYGSFLHDIPWSIWFTSLPSLGLLIQGLVVWPHGRMILEKILTKLELKDFRRYLQPMLQAMTSISPNMTQVLNCLFQQAKARNDLPILKELSFLPIHFGLSQYELNLYIISQYLQQDFVLLPKKEGQEFFIFLRGLLSRSEFVLELMRTATGIKLLLRIHEKQTNLIYSIPASIWFSYSDTKQPLIQHLLQDDQGFKLVFDILQHLSAEELNLYFLPLFDFEMKDNLLHDLHTIYLDMHGHDFLVLYEGFFQALMTKCPVEFAQKVIDGATLMPQELLHFIAYVAMRVQSKILIHRLEEIGFSFKQVKDKTLIDLLHCNALNSLRKKNKDHFAFSCALDVLEAVGSHERTLLQEILLKKDIWGLACLLDFRMKNIIRYDFNKKLMGPFSVLEWIVGVNHLPMLKIFLGYPSLYHASKLHDAAMIAIKDLRLDAMLLLLEAGLDLFHIFDSSNNLITLAAAAGFIELFQHLNTSGLVLANLKNAEGAYLIHIATLHQHKALVKYLLKVTDTIEVEDQNGCTPLVLAVQHGNLDIVKLLSDFGARYDCIDGQEIKLIGLAVFNAHLHVLQYFVEKGLNFHCLSEQGISLLHLAVRRGHLEVVQFLHEHGLALEQPYFKGMTPVMFAIKHGNLNILRYFLEHGFDFSTRLENGQSYLEFARETQIEEVYQFFLALEPSSSRLAWFASAQTTIIDQRSSLKP